MSENSNDGGLDINTTQKHKWSAQIPADRMIIMETLASNQAFKGTCHFNLLYPGSGWDYRSFWGAADVDRIFLIDPAPVVLRDHICEAISEWKNQLIKQLNLSNSVQFEDITFDYDCNSIRQTIGNEWDAIEVENYEIKGALRPGFSCEFSMHDRPRILTFIAARYEEFRHFQNMKKDLKLSLFPGIPSVVHIVYEHKSNISFEELGRPLNVGGCLIWGLPDNAPSVQWLVSL